MVGGRLFILGNMYSKGTIKLVWIPEDNYSLMESKMFDSVTEALNYAKAVGRTDFMLMSLIQTKDHYYQWRVLPYGSFTGYKLGMSIFKNKIVLTALVALTGYGLYKLIDRT